MTETQRSSVWGAPLANDGEERQTGRRTDYSSGQHIGEECDEYLTLTFDRLRTIKQVNLFPRRRGEAFPVDYTIEVSTDGNKWTTVATVVNQSHAEMKYSETPAPVTLTFSPVSAKQIRRHVTKLLYNAAGYYFQLSEFEAIDIADCNVGHYSYGTAIRGSNPLTTNQVITIDGVIDHMEDAGIKWVHIQSGNIVAEYQKDGTVTVPQTLIQNVKKLRKAGIQISFRFHRGYNGTGAEAAAYIEDYAKAAAIYVRALKDDIDYWRIFNEQNVGGEQAATDAYIQTYTDGVKTMSDAIRLADPGCKIGIELALIDIGWVEKIGKKGIGDYIDTLNVHIYKELKGPVNIIENVGTYCQDGVRKWEWEQPYTSYAQEFLALQETVRTYDPDCEIWCTEIAINTGTGSYNVTELIQAEWLSRAYFYHYMLGYGPTFWWMLQGQVTGETIWGLVDTEGRRRDSWYVLKNFSNILNLDYHESAKVKATFNPAEYIISKCYEHEDGTIVIPYWIKIYLHEQNTGRAADIRLTGIKLENAYFILGNH